MNHVCGYPNCQESQDYLLVSIDNGKELLRLCPNHVTLLAFQKANGETVSVETEPSMMEEDEVIFCELCSEHDNERNEEAFYIYRSMKDDDSIVELHLCETHLNRLTTRTFTQKDIEILREKHGDFYEIHHDFYDQEGYIRQPLDLT